MACQEGHFDIVKFLFDKGADINISDNYGTTPFYMSVKCNNIKIAKFIAKEAYPNLMFFVALKQIMILEVNL